MMLNEDHRPFLIKNLYYQKSYSARKLMKEFLAKTWKKIKLYFF